MINTSTDTHAPNASSSNSTGLAPDCLSPSIAVSSPPAFTPVNFNPSFQFSFTVRSLIQHLSQISSVNSLIGLTRFRRRGQGFARQLLITHRRVICEDGGHGGQLHHVFALHVIN